MIDSPRRVLAVSVFILLPALAGCGGSEPRQSAAEPSTSPPAETSAPAAAPSGADARSDGGAAGCEPTRPDMRGPYYEPNAPVRTSVGKGYVLSGSVLGTDGCEPVPDARIEFWLANREGEYDDAHRATVLAGERGRYRFETNAPVSYGGRPPHIHIRVTAPGYRELVTQHYPEAGQTEANFDLVLEPL